MNYLDYNVNNLDYYLKNFDKIYIYNSLIYDITHLLNFSEDYYFLHFNNLIEKNPLITLMLLKSANNKLFDLEPITNLSSAFNTFGLEVLIGFLLEYKIIDENINEKIDNNTDFCEIIYNKDINKINQISYLRKNFLSILLKKSNIFNKSYLETVIFISDLGILYTSDIIYNHKINDDFNNCKPNEDNEYMVCEIIDDETRNMNKKNFLEQFMSNLKYEEFYNVEKMFLNFDNYELFSSLLKIWNFPPIIYELIKNINNDYDDLSFDFENNFLYDENFLIDLKFIKLTNLIIDFNGVIYNPEKEEMIDNLINELNLNKDLIMDILNEM